MTAPAPVWTRAVAWPLGLVATVAAIAALVLLALNSTNAAEAVATFTAGGAVAGASFGIMGALIAAQRPDNRLGWVFLAIGISQAFDSVATEYAAYAIVTNPGALPGGALFDWLAVWLWAPGAALLATLSLLWFPTGRPPSPRWTWMPWVVGFALGLMVVPAAVAAWPLRGSASMHEATPAEVAGTVPYLLQSVGLALVVACMVAAVGSLILRYRRTGDLERQQLKWLAAAGALTCSALAGVIVWGPERLFGGMHVMYGVAVLVFVIPSIPVAVAIAIFRYRLYEIDRIVSRTVSYALLTGVLAGVYLAAVLGLSRLLTSLGAASELAVAAATLAAAALFTPARRRIQNIVDRRFNRARYDAEQEVAAFRERLRDEVDLADVVAATRTAAARTVDPAKASLWLRDGEVSR